MRAICTPLKSIFILLCSFFMWSAAQGQEPQKRVELFCQYKTGITGRDATTRFIVQMDKKIITRVGSVGVMRISDRMEDNQIDGMKIAAYGHGRSFVYSERTGEFALAYTLISTGGDATGGYIEGSCNRVHFD